MFSLVSVYLFVRFPFLCIYLYPSSHLFLSTLSLSHYLSFSLFHSFKIHSHPLILFLTHSLNQSINQSVNQSIFLSFFLSIFTHIRMDKMAGYFRAYLKKKKERGIFIILFYVWPSVESLYYFI